VGILAATACAPIIVPAEEGQFAERGLNVALQTASDSTQAIVSTATNQYDIAYISMGAATLNAFNRGADLKILAAGAAQPPGHGDNAPIIVRSQLIDSGEVKTIADLKGRKVAIPGRGSPDYKLAKALAKGGLTANDVDLQIIPNPEIAAALSSGAIDAAGILQPLGAQAVAMGVARILLDDYDPMGQGGLVVVNTHFRDQHPEAVTTFLEVYLQAIRRLADGKIKNDEPALGALQKYTNVPANVVRLSPNPYWPKDGHAAISSLREQQAFFMATGSTDYAQPLEIEKLIDYAPVDTASKRIGG